MRIHLFQKKFLFFALALVFFRVALPAAAAVSFVYTGSMHEARLHNSLVLLADGRVLAAGGFSNNVALASVETYDPATGVWTTNAPMHTARYDCTGTLLGNGQVLVAGGYGSGGIVLTNAELFDPAAGTWTFTGLMHEPRAGQVALLLPNGKTLLAGGGYDADGDGFNSSPTAELYDPTNGTWAPTGGMAAKRQFFTLTLLTNGKVLAVGGNFSGHPGGGPSQYFPDFTSAELYDPTTETWTLTGSLPVGRRQHTTTLLTNGMVLVSGGSGTNDFSNVSGAVLYDPISGTWSATGSPSALRAAHTATLLPDGTVLTAGGNASAGIVNILTSAEIYNPRTGTWSATGSLRVPRFAHSAPLLLNGKVLVAGGSDNTAEIYDSSLPATVTLGSLSQVADGTPRNATATTIPAGLPVTFRYNGSTTAPTAPGNYTVIGTVETFNHSGSATNTLFVDKPTLTVFWGDDFYFAQPYDGTGKSVDAHVALSYNPFNSYSFDLTYDGLSGAPTNAGVHLVQVATHYNPDNRFYDVQASRTMTILYSAGNFAFTNASAVNLGRFSHTATLLTNGQVLIAGGQDHDFQDLGSAELYDATAGIWTATGDLNNKRTEHTATLLPNGNVLVTGGFAPNGLFLANCELYNPDTGVWTVTSPMTTARYRHTATLLDDGKVLAAGGLDNPKIVDSAYVNQPLSTAEIYDPATETWTPTGSMNPAIIHEHQAATLLPNGQVLVCGGYDTNGISSTNAEVFDPARGTWRATGGMNIPRVRHTATVLPNGRVLVAGGDGIGGADNAYFSAEIYDPATGGWTLTGSMHHIHVDHTATLLPSGLVLVTGGGGNGFDPSASAEIYYPALGLWSDIGTLTTNRAYLTATLLTNGKVLVTGGYDANSQAQPVSELSDFAPWILPPPTIPILLTGMSRAPNGAFQFGFTNALGASFTVLTATNLDNWTEVPGVMEIAPGQFQFIDPRPAREHNQAYQVRSP